jgi:pilus assembly protein CpaF
MEITECEIEPDGTRNIRTLYKFNVTDNNIVNGKLKIIGEYEKVNDISKSLQKRLLENGMPRSILQKFIGRFQTMSANSVCKLGGDSYE